SQPGSSGSGATSITPLPDTVPAGGVTGAGVNSPSVTSHAVKSRKSEEPATGINLSGCFESWGVSSSQPIETARIEFEGLTVQQVKQILQRIPSTFKATLEISYKEQGEQ